MAFFAQTDFSPTPLDELTPAVDEPIQLSTIQTLQSAAIHTGDAIAAIPHELAAPAAAVGASIGKWVGLGLAGLVATALVAKKVGLL